MAHENYPTKRIEYTCAYCFNENLVIDDDFDENGGYRGTIYYCTCYQAKLEQQMLKELEETKNKEIEIRKKYENELNKNIIETYRYELKILFKEILGRKIYGRLDQLTDEELVEDFKEALREFRTNYYGE